MKTSPSHSVRATQELDLAVTNLDTAEDETRAAAILKGLHGIEAVRIIERGIWVSFHPDTIHHGAICDALWSGGFKASVFQDSETGETGSTTA